jgi:hypothetical protein
MFLAKYGPKAIELLKANPGKAAIAGAGLVGAGGLGAAYGVHKTKEEIPHKMLSKLGLPPELWDQSKEAVTDATAYAEKHPVAGALIGGAATSGAGNLLQSIIDRLSAEDETRAR